MTVEQRIGEEEDQFPIGMRVLAVDDDPTCLLILETLLRRCQYKVITTSQAITALRLLRENKDNFDLVISDVHMPDMDGFKLLEYVGLEMDLPVIMLSAHSDPKLVMKGITHGACDYLVKPVRIEELKNIWQHVIRRRSDNKDRNGGKVHHGNDEGATDNKPNKKRKDQKEDDEEDHDEDRHENEDPMTQKKPRVVWSVDLHGKFVAAVNQLGIDKAVPKKILDLMNVDKLTRENVASHLQKYRLFLKKYSAVANQQALADVSYLHMGSVSGFGPQHMVGPGHFQNAAFRSLPTGRMLERLNSPSSLGIRDLPSPGVPHLNHMQAPSHLTNSHSYYQPNILQGMPISVELDANMHQGATRSREVPNGVDSRTAFPVLNGFSGGKIIVGTTNNPFLGISNKPMTQEVHPQGVTLDPKIEIQCPTMASIDSGFSPHYSYCGRWSDSLPVSARSTGIQSNSFASSDSFEKAALLPSDIGQSMSTMALQKTNVPSNISPVATLPLHLQDSKVDLPCQVDSISGNAARVMNYAPQDSHKADFSYHANAVHSTASSAIPVNQTGTPLVQSLRPDEVIFHKTGSLNSIGQSTSVDASSLNHNDVANLALDTPVRSKDGYMIGQQSLPDTYNSTNFGSLEDFVSAMVNHDRGW